MEAATARRDIYAVSDYSSITTNKSQRFHRDISTTSRCGIFSDLLESAERTGLRQLYSSDQANYYVFIHSSLL